MKPPLRLIHSDAVLTSRRYVASLSDWQRKTVPEIVESLRPGLPDALKVKPDGRVFDGNTRICVLIERGYNVNDRPREVIA